MDVYISFIYNCKIVGSTKVSFSGWIDKYTVVYPDKEILFGTEKKWGFKP